jgi:hypothetical protein
VLACRELDDCKRIGREPTGRVERRQRRSGEAAAVRRVQKRQRVRRRRAGRAGGVAGNNPSAVAFAEHHDVPAKGRESLAVLFNECGLARTTRQCLETQRAGSGKSVEHRRTSKRDTFRRQLPMRQDVEQRFASPIARRPYRLAGRREQSTAAMSTGDDPHELSPGDCSPADR